VFLQPLFAAHDRAVVEVFAYSAVERPDVVTDWFRSHAEHWRNIRGLGHPAIAELIRSDGIDILVDLAGHTLNQPLEVFALQPAPVQVAWLGYPATTGLPQIGYRLTDDVADPPGDADRFHAEQLVRLAGGFHCYRAPDDAPPVSSLPASGNGFITFASFNNIAKVTPAVIATWAEVLRALPDSRLLLKGKLLAHEGARARIRGAFEQAGVSATRLELRNWMPRSDNPLAAYGKVDIALDTFPYNGTTTTFEALWMGVPVITLRGTRHAARVGASILSHLGHAGWIAEDPQHYVASAVELASDLPALASLRHALRATLAGSSLADAPGFAHRIETAYRNLLQRTDG
jgi:predicted O-linked N-acetylglucosamine transferase (SPINDLY family)